MSVQAVLQFERFTFAISYPPGFHSNDLAFYSKQLHELGVTHLIRTTEWVYDESVLGDIVIYVWSTQKLFYRGILCPPQQMLEAFLHILNKSFFARSISCSKVEKPGTICIEVEDVKSCGVLLVPIGLIEAGLPNEEAIQAVQNKWVRDALDNSKQREYIKWYRRRNVLRLSSNRLPCSLL